MAPDGKRKDAPTDAAGGQGKKKKQGNEGRWRTPHHQAKAASFQEGGVAPGDVGVWVTCARNQEGKAAREISGLFEEYAEVIYGVKQDGDHDGDGDGVEDIEASVRRELESMKAKGGKGGKSGRLFTPVKLNVHCLLFVKTGPPVEPVDFIRHICRDAAATGGSGRTIRSRYVNRLTPVSKVGRATEQGLADVAEAVLSPWFDLSGKRAGADPVADPGKTGEEGSDPRPTGPEATSGNDKRVEAREQSNSDAGGRAPYSFAIRPSIRNNASLKRDAVIKQIAALINDQRHKVNLTAPDKVILVDVYQNVCGMSVVNGDWDDLKRYNLSELYNLAGKKEGGSEDA